MDFNIIDHHRNGPPIGIGALAAQGAHGGAVPVTDEEARQATGGSAFQLWVYYEGRNRGWW